MHDLQLPGHIYTRCCNADDCSGNWRTIQRNFVLGGCERQTHVVTPTSQEVCVEEVGAIGKVDRAVGF